jgi:hypothetical protein
VKAALAAGQPVRVTGFGDRGPGASPGLPLRTAEITAPAPPSPPDRRASQW